MWCASFKPYGKRPNRVNICGRKNRSRALVLSLFKHVLFVGKRRSGGIEERHLVIGVKMIKITHSFCHKLIYCPQECKDKSLGAESLLLKKCKDRILELEESEIMEHFKSKKESELLEEKRKNEILDRWDKLPRFEKRKGEIRCK